MLRRAAIIHTEVSCHQWRRAAIIARCCSLLASPPHQVTCLGPLTCCAVTSMPWCTCAFTHIPCLHALPERTSSTVTVVPCDLVVATEGYRAPNLANEDLDIIVPNRRRPYGDALKRQVRHTMLLQQVHCCLCICYFSLQCSCTPCQVEQIHLILVARSLRYYLVPSIV